MFAPTHDFFTALHNARVATRKRDFAAAHKWMMLAERHVKLMERMVMVQKRLREDGGYIDPG